MWGFTGRFLLPATALSCHRSCCRENSEHRFPLSPCSRPPQLRGHQQSLHPPAPHTPARLYRARSCVHSVTLMGDGNHRKPASTLTGRFETQTNVSVHELTALTSSNITSCERRRDTTPPLQPATSLALSMHEARRSAFYAVNEFTPSVHNSQQPRKGEIITGNMHRVMLSGFVRMSNLHFCSTTSTTSWLMIYELLRNVQY